MAVRASVEAEYVVRFRSVRLAVLRVVGVTPHGCF
jgi:hypothetical protein